MLFKKRVLGIAARIPKGKFLTYKQVAERAGKPRAYRAIANILKRNRDPKIFCHRVIRSDRTVGGYLGSEKLSWLKVVLFLKDGLVGVIPTDTIYGLCASALDRKAVERVYQLKKRGPRKPMIILIGSFEDLQTFAINLKVWQRKILRKLWPGKVSVILPCPSKELAYLHRGTETLAFRLPKKAELLKILSVAGPLIAPSANWESAPPAKTVAEAKKYFGNRVFYYDAGRIVSPPSTLVRLKNGEVKIERDSTHRPK